MKTLLVVLFIAFGTTVKAQSKSDTLTIPEGKYKFIKVGEKVYKIVSFLEEVKQEPGLLVWPKSIYQPNFYNNGNIPLDSIITLTSPRFAIPK